MYTAQCFNSKQEVDYIDTYPTLDEAVALVLNHWWEESDTQGMVWVRDENNNLVATLTSQKPTIKEDRIFGVVHVVTLNEKSGSHRAWYVEYVLDEEGMYAFTVVRDYQMAIDAGQPELVGQ
jgi:hypothetical protein